MNHNGQTVVGRVTLPIQLGASSLKMAQFSFPVAEAETAQELERLDEELIEPNCRVLIHNDDVTPFEFVIMILQRIFELNALEAERIAYVAHTSGIALVAIMPCAEANKRVGKAHFAASLDGYPLMFTVEPET